MLASGNAPIDHAFVRENLHTVPVILRLLDVVALSGAGWLSYYFWYGHLALDLHYRLILTIATLTAVVCFELAEIYRPQRARTPLHHLGRIAQAAVATVAALFVIIRQWIPEFAPEEMLALLAHWGLISLASVAGLRLLVGYGVRWLRRTGLAQGRVLVVGMSEMARSAIARARDCHWAGIEVVGYVDDRPESRLDTGGLILPRLGAVRDLPTLVREHAVDRVWVCYPLREEEKTRAAVDVLRHETVNIQLVIDCFSLAAGMSSRVSSHVAGIPTLDISVSPLEGFNRYAKEIEDRSFALLFLILLAPLMLFIAAGVKLSSPGPVFYRQERVGWNNRKFMMLKFRSMPVDVEAASGPVWARPGESRATPFGAFLRKTSLDELPQLINVLRGEMSLVGPRPERPQFVDQFKDKVPNYMKKHLVKAGITGWAQVNGWRGDTDLGKRIEHDLYYINNWSLWFDFAIALRTIYSGMVNKNAY